MVTNQSPNLSKNLLITKFDTKYGDNFVTKFVDQFGEEVLAKYLFSFVTFYAEEFP